MSVYFIACAGFIKIGYSENPERRVRNLFRSSSRYSAPRAAYEARGTQILLRAIEGDKGTEGGIHRALRDFYVGCEWFVDEPAVREFIAAARADDIDHIYARLPREGGQVRLPDGENGGRNWALAYEALAKQQQRERAARAAS